MKLVSLDAPTTWAAVVGRALTVAVTAFVVLQAKEYYDASAFDTPANTVDALLVGTGTFLVYAVMKWRKS